MSTCPKYNRNQLYELCKELLFAYGEHQEISRCEAFFKKDFPIPVDSIVTLSRPIFQQREFHVEQKKWIDGTLKNIVICEELLRYSLSPDLYEDQILKTIPLQNPNEFLLNPGHLTAADLVIYIVHTNVHKLSSDFIDKWCNWMYTQWTNLFNLIGKSSKGSHVSTLPKKVTDGDKHDIVNVENLEGSNLDKDHSKNTFQPEMNKNEIESGFTIKPTETNFIRQIIETDLQTKRHTKIITRFPPEPNGYLHIGHAKSICINFGLAREFNGQCHLRFDDTNPETEEKQYIESIKEDVRWMGGNWGQHLYYTSDYFDQLYQWAVQLIKQGDAYVDDQTEEELRLSRGSITQPGTNSRFRDRTVQENLDLFEKMKNGHFKEGACVLRAKIDMKHPNMWMRDPSIYRIKAHPHPRTGTKWKIYPTYDFAHGQSDSIEKITHSICTLEFEEHRPLYEWFQEKLNILRTRQIEFARLNCTYMITSKRKLNELVQSGIVEGWDDPRLPTLSGLRRRGIPAQAIQLFCNNIGVSKRDVVIDYEYLMYCTQLTLHPIALRCNFVQNPLRVVITNFESNNNIELEFQNHPECKDLGVRKGNFSKILYIEKSDFEVFPPTGYFRLCPNGEVRLKYGFWIKCYDYKVNPATNEVMEVYCTYDSSTKGGHMPADGRKVKGTLHWVSESDCIDVTLRVYDHISTSSQVNLDLKDQDKASGINPKSLQIFKGKGEKLLKDAKHPYNGGQYFQFERIGFAVPDYSTSADNPIFNLTATLTDTWSAKTSEDSSISQRKEQEKQARLKAAELRNKKKHEREQRALSKSKNTDMQQTN